MGTKYRCVVPAEDGWTYRVDLQKDGYSGSITEIDLAVPAFEITWGRREAPDLDAPFLGSYATVYVLDRTQALAEIFDADEREWQVLIERHFTSDPTETFITHWLGYIVADQYRDQPSRLVGKVEIRAEVGLSSAEGISYDPTTFSTGGTSSLTTRLIDLLGQAQPTSLFNFHSTYVPNLTGDNLASGDLPLDHLFTQDEAHEPPVESETSALSVRNALEQILRGMHLQAIYADGEWWVLQRPSAEGPFYVWTYDEFFSLSSEGSQGLSNDLTDLTEIERDTRRYMLRKAGSLETSYQFRETRFDDLVANGTFEDWTSGAPDEWTIPDTGRIDRMELGDQIEGSTSLGLVGTATTGTNAALYSSAFKMPRGKNLVFELDFTARFDTGDVSVTEGNLVLHVGIGGYVINEGTVTASGGGSVGNDNPLPVNAISGTATGQAIIPVGQTLRFADNKRITLTRDAKVGDTVIYGDISGEDPVDDTAMNDGRTPIQSGDTATYYYFDTTSGSIEPSIPEEDTAYKIRAYMATPGGTALPREVLELTFEQPARSGSSQSDDRIVIDQLSAKATDRGNDITAYVVSTSLGSGEDVVSQAAEIGSGPEPESIGGLIANFPTLGGFTDYVLTDWKDGYYDGGALTGYNLAVVRSRRSLTYRGGQREVLEIRYFARDLAEILPHEVISRNSKTYQVTYLQKTIPEGSYDCDIVEISASDISAASSTEAYVGASSSRITGASLRLSTQVSRARTYPTVSDMSAASGAAGQEALTLDVDRGGVFKWSATGTVDNVNTFSDGGGGYWQRVNATGAKAKYAGATGDGSTDDRDALANMEAATGHNILTRGTYKVDSDITLGTSVLEENAILKPASGQTITLDVHPSSSLSQHFDLSLGGSVVLGNLEVPVEWFTSALDGSVDNSDAFEAAVGNKTARVVTWNGKLKLTRQVLIRRSGVFLRGGGFSDHFSTDEAEEGAYILIGADIQDGSGDPDDLIKFTDTATSGDRTKACGIEGITVFGDERGFEVRSAVHFDGVAYPSVSHCRFELIKGTAFEFTQGTKGDITQTHVSGCGDLANTRPAVDLDWQGGAWVGGSVESSRYKSIDHHNDDSPAGGQVKIIGVTLENNTSDADQDDHTVLHARGDGILMLEAVTFNRANGVRLHADGQVVRGVNCAFLGQGGQSDRTGEPGYTWAPYAAILDAPACKLIGTKVGTEDQGQNVADVGIDIRGERCEVTIDGRKCPTVVYVQGEGAVVNGDFHTCDIGVDVVAGGDGADITARVYSTVTTKGVRVVGCSHVKVHDVYGTLAAAVLAGTYSGTDLIDIDNTSRFASVSNINCENGRYPVICAADHSKVEGCTLDAPVIGIQASGQFLRVTGNETLNSEQEGAVIDGTSVVFQGNEIVGASRESGGTYAGVRWLRTAAASNYNIITDNTINIGGSTILAAFQFTTNQVLNSLIKNNKTNTGTLYQWDVAESATNYDESLALTIGTVPSALADAAFMYGADADGAGTASPHFKTEEGDVIVLRKFVEAALANSPNTGDANTDALITAIKDIILAMNVGAAS